MRRYFIKSKELGSDKTAYEEYHIGIGLLDFIQNLHVHFQ